MDAPDLVYIDNRRLVKIFPIGPVAKTDSEGDPALRGGLEVSSAERARFGVGSVPLTPMHRHFASAMRMTPMPFSFLIWVPNGSDSFCIRARIRAASSPEAIFEPPKAAGRSTMVVIG